MATKPNSYNAIPHAIACEIMFLLVFPTGRICTSISCSTKMPTPPSRTSWIAKPQTKITAPLGNKPTHITTRSSWLPDLSFHIDSFPKFVSL